MNKIILWVAIIAIAVLVVVGASLLLPGKGEVNEPAAEENVPTGASVITIEGFSFNPGVLTVPVGTKVVWKNDDAAPHQVVANDNTFVSQNLGKGNEFSFTFGSKGEFDYYCGIHPSMKGQVIVE